MQASGLIDRIGGEHYITEIYTIVYSSANWDEYFKTISDCYLRRKIHFAAKRMALDALDRSKDPEDIKEEASREITGMMTTKTESVHIAEVFNSRITAWEEAARTGGQSTEDTIHAFQSGIRQHEDSVHRLSTS